MKNEEVPNERQLRDWILAWCDDTISVDETRQLERALLLSPKAQRLFAELTLVNATLESLGAAGSAPLELDLNPGRQLAHASPGFPRQL